MKILFIVSWWTAYDAEVIREGVFHYEQALALKEYANTEVAIYFPFDNSIEDDFHQSEEKGLLVFRRKYNFNRIQRYFDFISDYKCIKNDFNPDVIHAHVAGGAGRVSFLWKMIYRVPYVLTEHEPVQMMHLDKKKLNLIHDIIYKNSFKTICVSKDLAEKLQQNFKKQKFSIIYNGVFSPEHLLKKEDIYDIEKNHKINIAIVAAFYDKEVKGFQYLLPAIKTLKEQGKDICLHICGGGDYLEFYKNIANELGISDNCIFYGQIEKNKVYKIVSQMNFVVSSSLFESAGVSVEEAMLLGKPLVVTKSGGASSLVTDKTAIIVDTKSSDAIVVGISKMIENLNDFDSEEIKKYAQENFSMEAVTNKYLQIYEEYINSL